jgi:transcription initiation factor TFIIF subunit beta
MLHPYLIVFTQKTKPKPPQGGFERMAHMPRNQLLDLIFQLFRDQPIWGIKPLRDKTRQPEVYLKEVLSEVALLHRSRAYNGLWELKENFRGEGVSVSICPDRFLLFLFVALELHL